MLTASTVTDTGQTGSPPAKAEPEAEGETDLFLKKVAKTSWGLLCVLDNVIKVFYSNILVRTGKYNCNCNFN